MSQTQVGAGIGVTQQSVKQWENGKWDFLIDERLWIGKIDSPVSAFLPNRAVSDRKEQAFKAVQMTRPVASCPPMQRYQTPPLVMSLLLSFVVEGRW